MNNVNPSADLMPTIDQVRAKLLGEIEAELERQETFVVHATTPEHLRPVGWERYERSLRRRQRQELEAA